MKETDSLYQSPRGTEDILPEDQPYWHFVRQQAARIAALYGYQRTDTPVFEDAGLFVRSVGEGTDIVSKEMYTFEDRGGDKLTLRPEGTAPICRAYLEHGMQTRTKPVKLYYLSSIFRYDRPQAGRYRQHHQFGFEAIGEADASLDAEVIEMAWRFYNLLGINDLSLELNSIGCRECRPAYISALKAYYQRYEGKLCSDCKTRLDKNTLRLLDCKREECQCVAENAPRSADYLCPDCLAHYNRLKECLTVVDLPFHENFRLVRGLDYYSRTVFEIQPRIEGAQSTIGGGGRYDGLIEQLGGESTPAMGFATGIERIILNLKRQGITPPSLPSPSVFLAYMGEAASLASIALASDLRKAGIGIYQTYAQKSIKAQLRQANSLGADWAVILGEEELKQGCAVLRNMKEAGQATIPLDQLICEIKKQI
ncbi:MAG: histidine--tRNA ligase [Dehalococcoides mccartyi]|uniref:histidine--tRNA ligase n=1 Tax=Dehalococcoides mccartyi TaxID=61435 RepID=UPI0030FB2C03